MNEIESRIKSVLADVLQKEGELDDVGPDTDLVEEYGLDSLQTISFLLRIEDTFDVELDYDSLQLSDLRSIRRFAEHVAGLSTAER
ncbi:MULTISPECIES: acyl carrier protein [Streptomyces]|uniref:Acyl carrier protein n=1 Tax=Streptomyces lycii TaxID=2654337 RepID=A0ABQ7FRJ4_9ACTN|nr:MULTISPECIES: acyl carrier protein [Streptomyces]KAF4410833.1 acyl carrier protein [Streptomyces lycii]PGH50540.1 acyl carrier protein [Streptomyces sp. Ru87]